MSLFIIGALAGTAVVKIGERNPNMSDGSAGYVLGWFNAAGMSGI